jgi:hypothetical protein
MNHPEFSNKENSGFFMGKRCHDAIFFARLAVSFAWLAVSLPIVVFYLNIYAVARVYRPF